MLQYRGFRSRGFHVVALFDFNDPHKIGQKHDAEWWSSHRFAAESHCCAAGQSIAQSCRVPAEAAHARGGFAGCQRRCATSSTSPRSPLNVPPHVSMVPVDLSVQLENLAYKVQKMNGEVSTSRVGLELPLAAATTAKMRFQLPGGETVSQQVFGPWFSRVQDPGRVAYPHHHFGDCVGRFGTHFCLGSLSPVKSA